MQNRYVGDIGDFGKYGMLRALLQGTGIRLGVNWYLVPDETHTNDGKYIEYLSPSEANHNKYRKCDITLYDNLRSLVVNHSRSVTAVQEAGILPTDTIFYSLNIPMLAQSESNFLSGRRNWFKDSLSIFNGCNLLFLDPNNGLEVASAPIGSAKSCKYVMYDEIMQYYMAGYSLIVYNHRDRSSEAVYQQRFKHIRECIGNDSTLPVIRFRRYSVRDYVFVIHDEVADIMNGQLQRFAHSRWEPHWQLYEV